MEISPEQLTWFCDVCSLLKLIPKNLEILLSNFNRLTCAGEVFTMSLYWKILEMNVYAKFSASETKQHRIEAFFHSQLGFTISTPVMKDSLEITVLRILSVVSNAVVPKPFYPSCLIWPVAIVLSQFWIHRLENDQEVSFFLNLKENEVPRKNRGICQCWLKTPSILDRFYCRWRILSHQRSVMASA